MRKNLTPEGVFAEYEKGESYNRAIELYGTTQKNEDFYVGDQWKGVNAPDLEKPVINFLKRAVCYLISMIVSDDVSVALTPGARSDDADFLADCLEGEVANVIEQTKAKTLARDMLRNCAVDGDGCFYFWFEPTGGAGGRIRIENLDNTKVLFGNPYVKEAEDQPYIIIVRRRSAAELREEAKTAGAADWENIRPDGAGLYMNEGENAGNDLATELIRLWKEDGTIRFLRTAKDCLIKPPADTGLRRYPLAWMNWESVKNSYHGRAAITGVIPNQIFVNKLWAMAMEHEKHMAFPKLFYDITKIRQWTNRVGQAIGVAGDPNTAVASSFRASDMSAQAMELVEKTISYTKECLGASDVALGNIAMDNTSAIIALQRAAATPSEMTKQNLYQSVEELYRIYLEFMAQAYGQRLVDMETPAELEEAFAFIGREKPEEISLPFDFSQLKQHPMTLKLDVGASSYYSEIAAIQTLDNLLTGGHISALQYLERIPDGYIPARRALINEMKAQAAGGAGAGATASEIRSLRNE